MNIIKWLSLLVALVAAAAPAVPAWAGTTDAGDEFWDTRFGPQRFGPSGSNDWITDAWADGSGLFVAGYFNAIGGTAAKQVAHWDGSNWHSLGSGLDGVSPSQPNAIIKYGNDVVVAGSFDQIGGGVAVENIARFDGTDWHDLGGGVGGSVVNSSLASALHVSGGDLYVSGHFELAGGQPGESIVKWDGSSWTALAPNGFHPGAQTAYVWDVTTSGNDVYIGGSFSEIDGLPVYGVARWSNGTWYAVGSPASWSGGGVYALYFQGSDLYIGGGFFYDIGGGVFASRVARWDGSQWHVVADPPPKCCVQSLGFYHGDLFIGGDFDETADQDPLNSIGRWTAGGWDFMNSGATGTSSSAPRKPSVNAMAVYDDELVAVGAYDYVAGSLTVGNIARWSGNGWLSHGVNNRARVAATVGSDVYLGGDFDRAGDISVNRITRWDGSVWHDVGGGIDGQPRAMVAIGSDVYVAGDFMQAGGVPAQHIARWDGANWHALGSGIDGTVSALATDGTHLYAGGDFFFAGGNLALDVAKWDGSSWTGMNLSGNGPVSSLAVRGGDLYAGGAFTQIGGLFALWVARWDGTQWVDVGGGLGDEVISMATVGGDLYVSGDFDFNPWGRASHIARWDGANWHALDDGTAQGIDAPARAMVDWDGSLLAVGEFVTVGSVAANRIASWDGSQWTAFGSGLNEAGDAVAVAGRSVYVGGEFARAGGTASYKFAHWNDGPTAVENTGPTASAHLEQNIPNPFNPVTTIRYRVPEVTVVSLRVYDGAGRLVRTLVDGSRNHRPGGHEVTWDGRDDSGRRVSSGVYFYQLRADAHSETRKMVLIK
jgi:hypothetical protein